MTKPTTYYAQSSQVSELVRRFGDRLEHLTYHEKLTLRAALALYCCGFDLDRETLLYCHGYSVSGSLNEVVSILHNIPIPEAEGLIEALTAQLREPRH